MGVEILSRGALNRATLQRQMLLQRVHVPIVEAVEHLVGMQAQLPMNPYLGLWSRIADFDPEALGELVADGTLVRIVVMRATIHLVSADDALLLRPLMQPVLDKELARHPEFGPPLQGVDMHTPLAAARELLSERALNGTQLRDALATRFPALDARALAYAARNLLALVQVPPRGVWRRTAQVRSMTVEAYLGRDLVSRPSIDDAVRRYLGAFGPASVQDVAYWSRLTGMREVVERLRPELRTFHDDDGREMFDLPEAPRPDPATPAPPRFVPEYDNVWLSFADRRRLLSPHHPGELTLRPGPWRGGVLIDGVMRGAWLLETERDAGSATLAIEHVGTLSKRASSAVAAEGRRLLRLIARDASEHDVRVTPST